MSDVLVENMEINPQITWQDNFFGVERTHCVTTYELLEARATGIGRVGVRNYDNALQEIERRLAGIYSAESYCAPGFTQKDILHFNIKPAVEVGGPTPRGYEAPLINPDEVNAYITNINGALVPGGVEVLDLFADGKKLPFKKGSLGVILASCLPNDVRVQFFDEAFDSLHGGGYLLYQDCQTLDIYHALCKGFIMKSYTKDMATESWFLTTWRTILQKP